MSTSKFTYEIRQKLYKNKKNLNSIVIYISFFLLMMILISGFIFLIHPMKEKYQTQLNTIFEYKEKSTKINDLKSISDELSKSVTSLEGIQKSIYDIVPDRKNVPYVTSQISLAAEKNDATITNMGRILEREKTVGEFKFKVIRYSIDLLSTYSDAVNFLATLETTKSIFTIENIIVSAPTNEELAVMSDPSLVKTKLVVDIYMKE